MFYVVVFRGRISRYLEVMVVWKIKTRNEDRDKDKDEDEDEDIE